MATLLNQEEEQEQQQAQQTAGPNMVSGAVTPVTQPAQTGTGASPFSNKQSTSPAANLRRYIEANQTNIGQNVAKNVEEDVEKAEGKFGNVKSTFEQNKSNLESLYNNQANQFQQQLSQQQYQPIVDDQNQFQTFQQLRDRDLSGINQFQDQYQTGLQELNPTQQRASERVQQFGNEQGRFKLLQDMFNKPGYSAGQQSLDQLLMQTDPSLRNLSTDLTRRDQTLQSGLSNLGQQFQEANPAFRNRATEVQQQLTQGLLGGEETLRTNLSDLAQQRTAGDDQMLADIKNRFSQNKLSMDDLNFLGITPDAVPNLIINDFSEIDPYLDRAADYTMQDVATQEDINRYSALNQLAGENIASQFNLILPDEQRDPIDDLYNIRTIDPFRQAYENFRGTRDQFDAQVTDADRQLVESNFWGRDRQDDIGIWGQQDQGWNIGNVLNQYQGVIPSVENPYGATPEDYSFWTATPEQRREQQLKGQFGVKRGDLRGIGQRSDFSLGDIQNYINTRMSAGGKNTTDLRRNRLYGETSQVLEDLYNRSRAAQSFINRLDAPYADEIRSIIPEAFNKDAVSTQILNEDNTLYGENYNPLTGQYDT